MEDREHFAEEIFFLPFPSLSPFFSRELEELKKRERVRDALEFSPPLSPSFYPPLSLMKGMEW